MPSVSAFQVRNNIVSVSIDNYLIGEMHNLFNKFFLELNWRGGHL